jgi:hypothetical protein
MKPNGYTPTRPLHPLSLPRRGALWNCVCVRKGRISSSRSASHFAELETHRSVCLSASICAKCVLLMLILVFRFNVEDVDGTTAVVLPLCRSSSLRKTNCEVAARWRPQCTQRSNRDIIMLQTGCFCPKPSLHLTESYCTHRTGSICWL